MKSQSSPLAPSPVPVPPPTLSAFETSVLKTLHALEAAIAAGRPPSPNPTLRTVLSQLDQLTTELPPTIRADLRHYLQKRSYQKARILLEGGDPEAGACPH